MIKRAATQAMNNFSKGCQLCQQGRWLCIFLTYQCSGGCHFCPAPSKSDRVNSAFGTKKEDILFYLKDNDFEGISFSGGDPFMVFNRLLEWQKFFKKQLPGYYFWVYTNGLILNKELLKQLADAGMDEIRFNIAASGYLSKPVWENIKIARELFPFVAIEIPSIGKDFPLLQQAIKLMESARVNYLNLHDYLKVKTDKQYPVELSEKFTMNHIMPLEYSRSSKSNTEAILQMKEEFSFQINHCSVEQKEEQMIQRRRKMASIFADHEYDIITSEGLIINYYNFPVSLPVKGFTKTLSDPAMLARYVKYRVKKKELKSPVPPDYKLFKLQFIPGMEINQGMILLQVDEVVNIDITKNFFQKN